MVPILYDPIPTVATHPSRGKDKFFAIVLETEHLLSVKTATGIISAAPASMTMLASTMMSGDRDIDIVNAIPQTRREGRKGGEIHKDARSGVDIRSLRRAIVERQTEESVSQ